MYIRKWPLAMVMIPALAACSSMPDNQTHYSMHQPVISRSNHVLDVSTTGGQLAAEEQIRLARWFEAMGLGYGDRISIDDPVPGGQLAVRSQVEELAKRHGLLVSDVAPVTTGQLAPSTVRVVVTRSTASVPGCPDWTTTSDINVRNGLSSNYGCATNSNLASMVADPEDMVRGQSEGANGRTDSSDKAIKSYRDQPPTGSKGLSDTSAASGGGQ